MIFNTDVLSTKHFMQTKNHLNIWDKNDPVFIILLIPGIRNEQTLNNHDQNIASINSW